jgi:alpha-tubulin suppressor-like RCC1 family protein
MSVHLWKAFFEDDSDAFARYLETAIYNARSHGARAGPSHGVGTVIGSPDFVSSSGGSTKHRKGNTPRTPAGGGFVLSKADINWRDPVGLTLLHHIASSTSSHAAAFATSLIEHPLLDIYIQDLENGWTALHRALYFGNITIARLILERDSGHAFGRANSVNRLVTIKDKEGLGPLDLYAATIKDRTLRPDRYGNHRSNSIESDEDLPANDGSGTLNKIQCLEIGGDQLFSLGSGNNNNLGLGDQDDRAFPERVNLRRPEYLLRRFYQEHLERQDQKWQLHDSQYHRNPVDIPGMWVDDIPWVIRSRPLVVRDFFMSKLHSAVLTTDPDANLYVCGHGQGGRLGVGDERTRFHFVCVDGGALANKSVATVALGQNHTLALSDEGEVFSWGNNAHGQLGYGLPRTPGDEDPISIVPRQIFGPLKRETVTGIAASRLHSVVHTLTSLFTFGKNEGQLGIIDSDARSLQSQVTPRKVAASLFVAPISAVAAIDRATVCLLDNHDVWVFANYGYAKIQFPLEGFSNTFLKQSFLVTTYDSTPNRIVKVTAEGETICALTSRGEVFTVTISQRADNQASVSTTNPAKIRSAISQPQRIWSPKKGNMAARDVGLDIDGSIILSTEEGSVWRRTKRAKIKDASAAGSMEYRPKDYKFSRIPGLTRVLAVRASGYGGYQALRSDCDVLKTQIVVEDPTLWNDLFPLLSLGGISNGLSTPDADDSRPRFWQTEKRPSNISILRKAVLGSVNIDADLEHLFEQVDSTEAKFDTTLATSTSAVRIPVHRFMLTARSRVLRRELGDLTGSEPLTIAEVAEAQFDDHGRLVLTFPGVDALTLLNLALYVYTDQVIDVWNFIRSAPKMAYAYRQVRAELMKISNKLQLTRLEPAIRQMVEPRPCLDMDFEVAFKDPDFFHGADILIELEDDEVKVHSALVCARCPFFEGLLMGRARGAWIAGRAEDDYIRVDLKHVPSATFRLVLRHIYCDTGPELFDDVVSTDVDAFLDTAIDVLGCANELMLDRLSQIAQSVAGQYVNARNVCNLLNAISPSLVHEFKDAALEYLCLNLEAMLQGHYLNELDPDLSEELDEVVRANQLASMPFAKSGRAERLLHERHPELAAVIARNRQMKIDAVALRSKHQDTAAPTPDCSSDNACTSPLQQKMRRKSQHVTKPEEDPGIPSLKTKTSTKDMMFDMDEEPNANSHSAHEFLPTRSSRNKDACESNDLNTPPGREGSFDARGKASLALNREGNPATPVSGSLGPLGSPQTVGSTSPNPSKPWTVKSFSTKTDMKDIMAQTASGRTSMLSQALASANSMPQSTPAAVSLTAAKMSQKDRKRMQHAQQSHKSTEHTSLGSLPESSWTKPFSWQSVTAQERSGSSRAIGIEAAKAPVDGPSSRPPQTPHLTMRQTVANAKPSKSPQVAAASSSSMKSNGQDSHDAQPTDNRPIPRSIRHQPVAELEWGLSMSDIVAQQQAEKAIIKEAMAKRDLQEIQAEQEFQEWWEKESARVQEAERRNAAATSKAPRKHKGAGRGKGRKGGDSRTAT